MEQFISTLNVEAQHFVFGIGVPSFCLQPLDEIATRSGLQFDTGKLVEKAALQKAVLSCFASHDMRALHSFRKGYSIKT